MKNLMIVTVLIAFSATAADSLYYHDNDSDMTSGLYSDYRAVYFNEGEFTLDKVAIYFAGNNTEWDTTTTQIEIWNGTEVGPTDMILSKTTGCGPGWKTINLDDTLISGGFWVIQNTTVHSENGTPSTREDCDNSGHSYVWWNDQWNLWSGEYMMTAIGTLESQALEGSTWTKIKISF